MNNKDIIPGYHGIMDLDVRNMDPIYIKQAIDQHYNDIKIYTAEQAKLKPEHRYENTVMRIDKQRAYISMKEKAYLDAIDKATLDRNKQYNNSKPK
jgi:hypothetical protein